MNAQPSLPIMQQTLPKHFPWAKRTFHQKKELPVVIKTLILSFLKTTVEDEIKSGKQRTMTEFLDDNFEGDLCYKVFMYTDQWSTGYGPFRHKEQALKRARDFVQCCPHAEVQVLSYDSRYLGDRSGNWCDEDEVFCYERE